MTIVAVILCVLAVILLLIAVILLAPVKVSVAFKEDFHIKAYLGFIRVYNSDKKGARPKEEVEKPQNKAKKQDGTAKRIFKTIKEKKGFIGAVKEILNFTKTCLSHTKQFLRYIKINAICLLFATKLGINLISLVWSPQYIQIFSSSLIKSESYTENQQAW